MSKIGKMPIVVPSGVTVTIQGSDVQVTGVKGNISWKIPAGIEIALVENVITVSAKESSDKKVRALFGLTRAHLANLVKGVDTGFEKKLELTGVGYKAQMQGTDVSLSLGFSHPVKIKPVQGITFAVADNVITVSGIDKILVGEMAAKIRAVRPPEPYKGKGITYKGEKVRRKAGKAAKAAGK
ncbi:MAG: 50S ribosomal protein L6 [Patescibacteria group bacterium]|mgnify:CR=1 FL=1